MHLGLIIATRPNVPKIAAIYHAIESRNDVSSFLVHTGQHYDAELMSDLCKDVGLPKPDYSLQIFGEDKSANEERIYLNLREIFGKELPDLVVVVGDVDATLHSANAVKKVGLPLAHVESGLRSFDLSMPEEKNRIETDHISDYLFVTEKAGVTNLMNEGIRQEKIHLVGNVMIDTLLATSHNIIDQNTPADPFLLFTMHRPANVDSELGLVRMIQLLEKIMDEWTVCFPVHPRTKSSLIEYGLWKDLVDLEKDGLIISPPMSYLKFSAHLKNAVAVLTDSGGIQEEALILETPCITLRNSTERPSTIEHGGNRLLDLGQWEEVMLTLKDVVNNKQSYQVPDLWDGKSADRIIDILFDDFNRKDESIKKTKRIPFVI